MIESKKWNCWVKGYEHFKGTQKTLPFKIRTSPGHMTLSISLQPHQYSSFYKMHFSI